MIVGVVIARAASSGNEALRDSAQAVFVRSRGDASIDPTRDLAQWEAIGQTMLGNKDEAFRQLSTVLATNPQQRLTLAQDQSWWFRDLRSDPRWTALAGK
jgi:hypothetical protein